MKDLNNNNLVKCPKCGFNNSILKIKKEINKKLSQYGQYNKLIKCKNCNNEFTLECFIY